MDRQREVTCHVRGLWTQQQPVGGVILIGRLGYPLRSVPPNMPVPLMAVMLGVIPQVLVPYNNGMRCATRRYLP
jgi:hypothetical protein